MKRLVRPAAALLAVGSVAMIGCHSTGQKPGIDAHTSKYVDPCWPERYNATARQEVLAPFAIQVNNAAILDATIWNHYFEPETDTLLPSGLQKLNYLVHRRPAPDARVYLQTTHDVKYDPTKPEEYVTKRQELDAKRAQAVQRYLGVQTASRSMNFEVQVIDAGEPTIRAETIAGASRGLPALYRSGLSGGAGGLAGTGGGTVAAPAGGGSMGPR